MLWAFFEAAGSLRFETNRNNREKEQENKKRRERERERKGDSSILSGSMSALVEEEERCMVRKSNVPDSTEIQPSK